MVYRPILTGFQWADLKSAVPNVAGAYTQGQQIALQKKQLAMQEEQFEALQAQKEAERQRLEMAAKKKHLTQMQIEGANKVRRAQASGLDPAALEKIYDAVSTRYQQTADKMGITPVDELAFPAFGAGAPVTAEEARDKFSSSLRQSLTGGMLHDVMGTPTVQPTVEGGKITSAGPEFTPERRSYSGGAGLATERPYAEQSFLERVGAAQRGALQGIEDPNKGEDAISVEAAQQLDVVKPGMGFHAVEYARQDPDYTRIRAGIAAERAKKAPLIKSLSINLREGPEARGDFQKKYAQQTLTIKRLDRATKAIGAIYNRETGALEGGDFNELFGWGARLGRTWL